MNRLCREIERIPVYFAESGPPDVDLGTTGLRYMVAHLYRGSGSASVTVVGCR